MRFRKAMMAVATTAMATGAVGATVGTASAATPGHPTSRGVVVSLHGQGGATLRAAGDCPSGFACIYSGPSWAGKPIFKADQYGAAPFNNINGRHRVFNNQTDNWAVWVCRGWSGTNCDVVIYQGQMHDMDLTEYNSLYLKPR